MMMSSNHKDNCQMVERIATLETKQNVLFNEFDDYKDLLRQNTDAINKLSEVVIEHSTIIQQQQQKENSFKSVIFPIIASVGTAIALFVLKIFK